MISKQIFEKYPEEFEGLSDFKCFGKKSAIFFLAGESKENVNPEAGPEWDEGWNEGVALWQIWEEASA